MKHLKLFLVTALLFGSIAADTAHNKKKDNETCEEVWIGLCCDCIKEVIYFNKQQARKHGHNSLPRSLKITPRS